MALAQSIYDPYASDTMLVAPDGSILDYVPEQGEVVTSRDRAGRLILIDRDGNVVATEMRNEGYAPRRVDQYPPRPGGYREYRDTAGYRDYREYRPEEPGAFTGSIPDSGSITRLPLEDQPYPQDQQPEDDYASIERQQQPLQQLEPEKPIIAVTKKPQAEVAALQVFLDREGISPGVIDGHLGENVNKAIAAWQEMTGETLDPNNSEDIMQRLSYSGGLPIVDYTITAADAAGPFVASIPEDYSQKAQLPAMAYTSTSEKLAEQFHMDENYLKALNPGVDLSIPGTTIKVISPGEPKTGAVTRIVADKSKEQVLAYGDDGNLIAAYPATIGSTATPSPSGSHTVTRIALNPGYTYNPKINFKQGNNDKILEIPPGPNGPVGTVWIALSKPTYGIHGTPEPSKIGKTNSNGCIRLTNWDATELAKMVKPGTTVEFVE
ncbi:L,D-transpeptidase family protein [Rhizobium halophilum]|uniref:L,D-transpeptidase family protein n=1 Tax=Rhizobium halophilum TaxID=2846852 RepID=UPI001EFD84C7|nr:L,D-transpeptidase family protein [Rhizobium halophilum]MCF6368198.1 L,D-transpeptidase [Rhizobium halophilum]